MKCCMVLPAVVACLLVVTCSFAQLGRMNTAKSRYAPKPPWGPRPQQLWYQSRGFEQTDFESQLSYEFQRAETERMRFSSSQQVQDTSEEDEQDARLPW